MNYIKEPNCAYIDRMGADQSLRTSSVPCFGYQLRKTDILGIELVNANQHTDSRGPQNPRESRAELGELAWVYVVHQERVKANVTVHDQGDTQDAVQDRVG